MRCVAKTKDGKKCKLHCTKNSDKCFIHTKKPEEYYCNECINKAIINGKCRNHYIFENDCPICLEKITLKSSDKLECGHLFHKDCLDKWFMNNYTCPMCRSEVEDEKVKYINREIRRNLYYLIFVDTYEPE